MIHFNSAGNGGRTHPQPPGGSPNPDEEIGPVNSVAGLEEGGNLFPNSSRGPGLEFAAPGAAVFTADRSDDFTDIADSLGYRLSGCNPDKDVDCCNPADSDCFGGLFVKAIGTSYASPYVAGIAAIGLSLRPDLTPLQLENIMFVTADDLGDPGYDTTFGHGRPNAHNLINYLQDYVFSDGFEMGDTSTWSATEP